MLRIYGGRTQRVSRKVAYVKALTCLAGGRAARCCSSMKLLRYLRDAAVFAPCYIALDWASYIDPVGPFNITPWNPQPALAIVWMMLGGLVHAPTVLATILLADIVVRHAPGGYAIAAMTACILAGGYAAIAWVLKFLLSDTGLRSTRQLTIFAMVVVAGTSVVGAAIHRGAERGRLDCRDGVQQRMDTLLDWRRGRHPGDCAAPFCRGGRRFADQQSSPLRAGLKPFCRQSSWRLRSG